jgi:hypothetical protein
MNNANSWLRWTEPTTVRTTVIDAEGSPTPAGQPWSTPDIEVIDASDAETAPWFPLPRDDGQDDTASS